MNALSNILKSEMKSQSSDDCCKRFMAGRISTGSTTSNVGMMSMDRYQMQSADEFGSVDFTSTSAGQKIC
jgi:hypothetical protein